MQSRSLRQNGHARMRRTLIRKRRGDGGPGRNAGFMTSAMALAGILLVLSCGDGAVEPAPPPPAPVATTVTVSPASATLTALEETARLTAEVRDQNGQVMAGATVAWSSSDASVAAVDASGQVTASANGAATITATAGSVSGTAEVTVAQVVNSVIVSPVADTLVTFGDTLRLSAEATDANGHAVAAATPFTWASSDTLVARVDDSGLVESLGEGAVVVTATTSDVAGQAELMVVPPLPTMLAVSPDTVRFTALGQTMQLAVEVREQSGRVMGEAIVSWASADTLVAAVDSAGTLTAIGGGTTTVRAMAGGVSGEVAVSVMQSAGSVVVSPAEASVALGDTVRLAAEAFDENGHAVAGAVFSWSSSDFGIARVDETGLVSAVSEGTARITAAAGDASGAAEIMVENPDRAALVALYDATDGPNWVNDDNWLSDASLGDWHGIDVDGIGRVVGVHLGRNNLSGELPRELGKLTALSWLNFGVNQLKGAIPRELGALVRLRGLGLGWNGLQGEIPPELGNLKELEALNLSRNQLSGALPRSLLELERLTRLWLDRNRGLCVPGTTLYSEWLNRIDNVRRAPFCNESDVAALKSLYEATGGADWTRAEGWLDGVTLDAWHGVKSDSLGRVTHIDLGGNGLNGNLPNDLTGLKHMTSLRIGVNALTGPLPLGLTALDLRELHYAGTGLCTPPDVGFRAWLNAIPSHEGTATECAPLSDRDILHVLHEATNGSGWEQSDGWLSDAPLGNWYGIETDDNGRVVSIELDRNGLEGSTPAELGGLTELTSLSLDRNRLSGEIPSQVGNLAKLRSLSLSSNNLSGEVPPELGDLAELQSLTLFSNDLSGEIPPEFGNLAKLERLILTDNRLSGRLPVELGDLAELQSLTLGYNDLSGEIPPELGNLAELQSLTLGYNDLSGEIPPELGNLAELRFLFLSGNDLSGEIPPEFGNLAKLERLILTDNRLSGRLPVALGRLLALRDLRLGNNAFSGQVPAEFADLTLLQVLQVHGNPGLSGPLPERMVSIGLTELKAGDTALCTPNNMAFRTWLASIQEWYIKQCGGGLAAYLTQAAQSPSYPVPLIAGESALLRVFVTADTDTDETMPPIRATFFVNGVEANLTEIPAGVSTIPSMLDEGELRLSANAEIPGEVILPGLEMVVEVDPEGTLDSSLGVVKRIPAEGRAPVDVSVPPTLYLTLIPFVHTSTNDYRAVGLVEELHPGHELFWETNYLLPVGNMEITKHDPVLIDSNDGYDLLRETALIRTMEGGTGHWKGMSYGVGNVGGVAHRGGKVSFSRPSAGTIAHELGHNFSLSHAPCGTVGDPTFPHKSGRIGVWGYDPRDGGSLVPPANPELMSYCYPRWISDYFFKKTLLYRIADEGQAQAAPVAARSLLVSGRLDADSTLHLDPAFILDAAPVVPDVDGPFTLTGMRSDGSELFSLAFDMREVADGDGRSTFLFAIPAGPQWESELASLSLAAPGRVVEMMRNSEPPMAILRDPVTGRVRAVLRNLSDLPAGPVAPGDLNLPALQPGLEVIVSRGVPETAAWRR